MPVLILFHSYPSNRSHIHVLSGYTSTRLGLRGFLGKETPIKYQSGSSKGENKGLHGATIYHRVKQDP